MRCSSCDRGIGSWLAENEVESGEEFTAPCCGVTLLFTEDESDSLYHGNSSCLVIVDD